MNPEQKAKLTAKIDELLQYLDYVVEPFDEQSDRITATLTLNASIIVPTEVDDAEGIKDALKGLLAETLSGLYED
jgi:hypothetical protein